MLVKWKSIRSLSDTNNTVETSTSFLPNKYVSAYSYLKETGTHFDSVQFLNKCSCYVPCTIIGVGI